MGLVGEGTETCVSVGRLLSCCEQGDIANMLGRWRTCRRGWQWFSVLGSFLTLTYALPRKGEGWFLLLKEIQRLDDLVHSVMGNEETCIWDFSVRVPCT